MFDIGFTELMLIGIVALVVIGPERLPAVARTAGQWIAKLQRFVRGVKTDLASELEAGDLKKLIGDQREQINELRNMVSSAKRDFENSTKDVVQGARKSLDELETSVKSLDEKPDAIAGNAPENDAGVEPAVSPSPQATPVVIDKPDSVSNSTSDTSSASQSKLSSSESAQDSLSQPAARDDSSDRGKTSS